MDNLEKQYKSIIKNLDKNIKNKEDLEYVKSEMNKLFMSFFDEIYGLRELYDAKIGAMLDRQAVFEEKIDEMESSISRIEKEFFLDDETSDLTIICPYCSNDCFIEIEDLHNSNEVECPECKNIIELNWNEEDCDCEDCSGECSCDCDGECDCEDK